jgi:CBS domain-containing protein
MHRRAPLMDTLTLMRENGISGVPVLDDRGVLVDMFCDSDLLPLTHFRLDLDVGGALQQVCVLGTCESLCACV